MDPFVLEALRAAEEAVRALVQLCHKSRPLYACDPRAAAQVSRTAKWHLNAIAHLRRVAEDAAGDSAGRRGA